MTSPFYNPAPVFLDNQGRPVAGGFLYFYESNTSTPKLTWSDEALTIPNANPVPLDSAGRANTNIWMKGSYSVKLTDSIGATIWTRNVSDGSSGQAVIPPMEAGKFLTNDGSVYLWGDVRQVPDPTGSANKILSTDGSALTWIAQPTIPDLPIVNTATSVKIGTLLVQWGSSQAPATGFRQSAVSVNFPAAFTGTPYFVGVTPRNVTHTAGGQIGVPAVTAKSTSGFSVQFDTDDEGQTSAQFIAPEPFDWIAYGPTSA